MNILGSLFSGFLGGATSQAVRSYSSTPTTQKTNEVFQGTKVGVHCQHNGQEGVSPGDLVEHISNAEIGQALNDVGVNVNQITNDVCNAIGNEVLSRNEQP